MTDSRPISFNEWSVRRLLRGIKTETRRKQNRYGKPGDTLWVRERHALLWPGHVQELPTGSARQFSPDQGACYFASVPDEKRREVQEFFREKKYRLRSEMFLPRAAARIVLQVEAIWEEPVQAITEEGARAEGVTDKDISAEGATTARDAYRCVWEKINHSKAPWARNPPITVVRFKIVEINGGSR